MNKKALMLVSNMNRGEKGRRVGVEYEDWGARNYYPMTEPYSGYQPMEDKFRDRRGREHYDNGRYAPQSRYDVWSDPTITQRYTGPRYEQDDMPGMRGGRNTPRSMIGFERDNQYSPSMHHDEYSSRSGDMERHSGNVVSMPRSKGFTPEMAEEWTSHMENEDGTTGPHWSFEQIEKIIAQRGIDCDPYKFWAIMNAVYSDGVKVAKKHNVNTMDYYVDMALSWLHDKDAVGDKTAAYYEYVVKH